MFGVPITGSRQIGGKAMTDNTEQNKALVLESLSTG